MKKVFLLVLAGTLVLGGCKKEGCTDSTATNYNADAKKDDGSCTFADPAPDPDTEKPVVTTTFEAGTKVKQGEKLTIPLTFTDNEGLAEYSVVSTHNNTAVTGTLSGKTGSISHEMTMGAEEKMATYTVTVTCKDAAGNVSEAITTTFEVISSDVTKPAVNKPKVNGPNTSGKLESGSTPNKVEFHITDDRGLESIMIMLYNKDLTPPKVIWDGDSQLKGLEWKGEKEYKKVLDVQFSGNSVASFDDNAEWWIIATDAAGNGKADTAKFDVVIAI